MITNRYFLLLCAALLFTRAGAQQSLSHKWVSPAYGNATLNHVTYAGSGTYYVAGGGSSALKTSDGGASWQQLSLPVNSSEFHMTGASFIDAGTGFIVGDSGIFKTTNGGQTWTNLIDLNNAVRASVVKFIDANHGWIGQYSFKKTTDGGATWEDVILASRGQANPVSLQAFSAASAVVILYGPFDGGGKVYKTDDGNQWTQVSTSGMDYDNGYFADASHGCLYKSSFNDSLYLTSDGGTTWTRSVMRDTLGEKTALGYFGTGTLLVAVSKNQISAVRTTRIMRSDDGGATWSLIALDGIPPIRSFAMQSATEAIAVGEGGVILKTTDAGLTWTNLNNTYSAHINGGAFRDADNGVACSEFGEVFRTSDGGKSWTRSNTESTGGYLQNLVYLGADSIIGVGYAGYPVVSADGGQTFSKMAWTGLIGSFYGLHYNPSNHTLIMGALNNVGGREDIYLSKNGGASYTGLSLPGIGSVTDFAFSGPLTGIGGAVDTTSDYKAAIIKTTDGGDTWTRIALPSAGNHATKVYVAFANATEGWALANGSTSQLWKTTDAGDSWVLQSNVPLLSGNWGMHDLYFTDPDTGYIIGDKGRMMYTHDGGNTWHRAGMRTNQVLRALVKAGNVTKVLSDFNGVMNLGGSASDPVGLTGQAKEQTGLSVYPNPCSSVFVINHQEAVLVRLYNLNGVLQLQTSSKTIDVSGLPKGIYFVQVTTKEGTSTRKVLVQ